jgi:hypothetical protein
MDPAVKTLLEQKLDRLAREQLAELMPKIDAAWARVNPGPNCIWIGDLAKEVRLACGKAIVELGDRVAAMLTETLRTLRLPYEEGLTEQLAKLLDPLFPENLFLAPVENTRGVHERGGNPQRFDMRAFDHELVLAQVTSANASRDARAKAQLAIDEYLLSVKSGRVTPKRWPSRLWDAFNVRPGLFGIGIDLKKLFGKKRLPPRAEQ